MSKIETVESWVLALSPCRPGPFLLGVHSSTPISARDPPSPSSGSSLPPVSCPGIWGHEMMLLPPSPGLSFPICQGHFCACAGLGGEDCPPPGLGSRWPGLHTHLPVGDSRPVSGGTRALWGSHTSCQRGRARPPRRQPRNRPQAACAVTGHHRRQGSAQMARQPRAAQVQPACHHNKQRLSGHHRQPTKSLPPRLPVPR